MAGLRRRASNASDEAAVELLTAFERESAAASPTSKQSSPRRLTSFLTIRTIKRHRKFFLHLVLFTIIVPLSLQIILAYYLVADSRLLPVALRNAKNFLIVTAHPDDECLFFSPSILAVLDGNTGTKGGLIVLSTGNNYGKGAQRKVELEGSCKYLGIEHDRCLPLDLEGLQDNPKVWWDESKIIPVVKQYVKKWDIDAILTFDEGGISGHLNHRAVSAAIREYASTDPKAPVAYTLTSSPLYRKYTVLGDLPFTAFSFLPRIVKAIFTSAEGVPDDAYGDRALVASSWSRYLKTRHAFASHESQYSWDRVLYLVVARHIWFNDLKRIERIRSKS